MARRLVLILATTVLMSLLLVRLDSVAAHAVTYGTNLPGKVTCSPAGGVWNGTITFTPPLMNGGTASTETFTVQAALGNSASPCITNAGFVALGSIVGKLTFSIPNSANNCATIFSGVTLPAPAGKFKMTWTSPAGSNPTKWTQPSAFKVTGAANLSDIAVKRGAVAQSFAPLPNPKATLSDANWPGAGGAVATGCASLGGLASLTLSTSTGTW
jgi:hypothetical protein